MIAIETHLTHHSVAGRACPEPVEGPALSNVEGLRPTLLFCSGGFPRFGEAASMLIPSPYAFFFSNLSRYFTVDAMSFDC